MLRLSCTIPSEPCPYTWHSNNCAWWVTENLFSMSDTRIHDFVYT